MARWIHLFSVCLVVAGLAFFLTSDSSVPAPAGEVEVKAKEVTDPKAYVETIPGSKVTFEMLPIPGGTYMMGSTADEAGRADDEGPPHPVKIRPFWMQKTEVTWDEYDLYWKNTEGPKGDKARPEDKEADAVSRPTPPYVDETYGHERDGHPALCMTQHAAMEYCRWLSLKTGKTYRLPTEAEWEYACRAGTKSPYFFGSDPKQLGDYAWFADNSEETTHKVGTKKPNPWGLHDMYGNVMEWCLDHYKKDYYASFSPDKPALWPVLVPGPDRFSHVARGGHWDDKADKLRSAARRGSNKEWIKHDPQRPQSIWWLTKWDFIGFRVVRPVDEQDKLKGLRSKVTKESN